MQRRGAGRPEWDAHFQRCLAADLSVPHRLEMLLWRADRLVGDAAALAGEPDPDGEAIRRHLAEAGGILHQLEREVPWFDRTYRLLAKVELLLGNRVAARQFYDKQRQAWPYRARLVDEMLAELPLTPLEQARLVRDGLRDDPTLDILRGRVPNILGRLLAQPAFRSAAIQLARGGAEADVAMPETFRLAALAAEAAGDLPAAVDFARRAVETFDRVRARLPEARAAAAAERARLERKLAGSRNTPP
jgi:hypothetical protein